MKIFFLSFLRWLNFLSLDVVLIALAWQEVFARAASVSLRWQERALLALSIWMVYIIDHWLDTMTDTSSLARIFHHSRDEEVAKADGTRQRGILTQGCMSSAYCPSQNRSLTQEPSAFPAPAVEGDEISGLAGFFSNRAPRHHYVKSHRILLGIILVLAFFAVVWLLCYLSFYLLIAGIVVMIITLSYLALNTFFLRRGYWLKGREIVISLIFSIGCALVGLLQGNQPWHLLPWMIVFAVVALMNCTLIARMERAVPISVLAPQWFFSLQWFWVYFYC